MCLASRPELRCYLRICDDGKLDEARLSRRMVDLLLRLAIILRLGPEDVRNKGLRIAVVEREPAGLHLHHDAVAGQENVVCRWQIEAVEEGLPRCDWLRIFETLAIAAAEDIGGDH